MKLANANYARKFWVDKIQEFVGGQGEDVGIIASNSFNFPIVVDDEEGWVEVVIKIPKESGDDGYLKRESYEIAVKEKAEKAKANAKKKAKKIQRDKEFRERKEAK